MFCPRSDLRKNITETPCSQVNNLGQFQVYMKRRHSCETKQGHVCYVFLSVAVSCTKWWNSSIVLFEDRMEIYGLMSLFMSVGWDCVSELRPVSGLLFVPQDMCTHGATVEWYWQGKLKNSERNLSQCHFMHHKSHTDWPGREPSASAMRSRRLTAWDMANLPLYCRVTFIWQVDKILM
jgi:hypothetical protein